MNNGVRAIWTAYKRTNLVFEDEGWTEKLRQRQAEDEGWKWFLGGRKWKQLWEQTELMKWAEKTRNENKSKFNIYNNNIILLYLWIV